MAEFMWSDDGSTWGSGSLYGVSPVAEDVIVYYNKEKLSSLGLSIPNTFAEFENALQVSKDAGELPIALGGADGWPIIHVWGLVEGAFVDPDQTRSWIFDAKNVQFDTPNRKQAAEKLADMATAGYFGSDSLGIGYDDANAMFINGEGVLKDLSKGKYWTKKAYENPEVSASTKERAEENWNTFKLWDY